MLKFDWNILFTFVNLIVFYLLMKKFLFGRIKKVMDERKALIQKQFDD
ncbi:MAG: ATP synthase F0 subunit B, partial [Eubacterium sp.]|nr:ATP synthase F0 subunit B [Eubacterium sp.]